MRGAWLGSGTKNLVKCPNKICLKIGQNRAFCVRLSTTFSRPPTATKVLFWLRHPFVLNAVVLWSVCHHSGLIHWFLVPLYCQRVELFSEIALVKLSAPLAE
jgi:hypothetical protein